MTGTEATVLRCARRVIEAALAGRRDVEVFALLCEDLVDAGLPLLRAAIGAEYLHPTFEVRLIRWRRGAGSDVETFERKAEDTPEDEEWLTSPLFRLHERGQRTIRRRLDPAAVAEFPMLAQFVALGGRDYLAFRQPLGRGIAYGEIDEVFVSFITDRESGFGEPELDLLEALQPFLTLAVGAVVNVGIGRTLLETYLGHETAARVLGGNIVRGRTETIRAVIWYSDLRGFTRLTDTLPRPEILTLLNEYAEPVVDAVTGEGGEVLKFIGDGVLAIFGGREPADACAAAIRAWETACRETAAISAARAARATAVTRPYLALHEGEVLYGNFGGRLRLDFTVLGPAVNEASRIAALCRSLDQSVITSDAFATACGPLRPRLVRLGRFALPGVGQPQMLWTLDPEAA